MADWDDDGGNVKSGGGFSGGRGAGFGGDAVDNKLRGFGRGRSAGGGFGSSNSTSSGGGFGRGSAPSENGFGKSGSGDTWDNNNKSGGGSRGGFGGGFGKDEGQGDTGRSGGGGFGSGGGGGGFGGGRGGGGGGGFGGKGFGDRSDDVPRGGGFGGERRGGGGGGSACFKCGEEGHMSRECPSGGGGRSGGSGACYKCGEEGHISRDCPSGGGGGGGRGSGCFKCGEEGHMSRECPNGGGEKKSGGGCYKCGEDGHFARECPSAEGGGSGGGGGFGGGGGGGKSGGGGCYKCGEDGHFARECPNAEEGDGERKGGPPRTGEAPYVPPPPPEEEELIFETLQIGINFNKYDDIPVECTGRDAPKSGIASFEDAGLNDTFLANVRRAKYDKPTPVQKWAIPLIVAGRDLMACAQTGSGKTAAFLLPVLTGMMSNGLEGSQFSEVQEPAAIIVAPTRELVIQIFNEARKFSFGSMLRPVVVYGGTSVGHQLREVERGAHLVVATPGRLLDFISRGKIGLSKVKFLILDEADRMLDMGFETDIRKLVEQLGMPAKDQRQTLMFSATFPEEIQKLAADFLNDYLFVTVGRVGAANTDIEQNVFQVTQFEKRDKLVSILNDAGAERTLVFVEQKRNADFLASYLSQSEFPTTSIHGDRQQREREEALRDFKSGRAPILIATSVAARGLDIPNVKHVVNYDMPNHIEEYVHRIGRTGRCGNLGKATCFFDSETDGAMARALIKVLQDAQQEVPDWLEETAQSNFGAGGFGGGGGGYGSRDTRRGGGRSGGKGRGGDSYGDDSANGFGGGGGGAEEEEEWG